jgi:hypothetical protein
LVAGVVRNGAKTISRTVQQLRKLFGGFADLEFFIVESDSSDSTVATLERLKASQPGFGFVSLGDLRFAIPDRILRISFARNVYLEYLETIQSDSENPPSHLVVADFDGVNVKIRSLARPSQLLQEQVVICANQHGRYYDILALRCAGWVVDDYRVLISEYIDKGESASVGYLENLLSPQIRISELSPEIEVDSAFGGLAIYPVRLLRSVRYSPQILADLKIAVCEHVSFSNQIRSSGGVIRILPSLRNTGDWRHTWFSNPVIINSLRLLLKNTTARKLLDRVLFKTISNRLTKT